MNYVKSCCSFIQSTANSFFFINLFLRVSSSQKPSLVVQKFRHSTVLWFIKIHVNIAFTIP